MGFVLEAEDQVAGKKVAVKLLPPTQATSQEQRTRFFQEAEALSQLDHPGFPSLYDVRVEPVPFFTMELIRGETLKDLVKHHGPQEPPLVLEWIVKIAQALQVAHQAGIVHRDVKPENLILQEDHQVRIIDLGIAANAHSTRITRTGFGVGTPAFTPPEQLRGEDASPANDVFGLAATGCYLLTGRPPKRGGNDESQALILKLPSDTAHWIFDPLQAALGPIENRPNTMEAFLETLKPL